MPTIKDGRMSMKYCMTAETSAQAQLLMQQNKLPMEPDSNCRQAPPEVKNGIMKLSFTCTNPASSGQGSVRMKGDTGYHMTMNMTSSPNGKPETETMEWSGTWLGANCGKIKPMPIPLPIEQ